MPVPDKPFFTFRELVGGVIAVMIVGSLIYSSTVDGSAAAGTALVGGAGAVTGWLFRGSGTPTNGTGNGYTNGTPPASPTA